MNTLLKRIISLVLCLVMVVGYVPVNAFADETGEAVSTEAPEVTPDAPAVVADEESEPEIPEAPKPEAPKPETPKPEAPKPEAPKPEASKPEAPKPEAPKPEAPKPEAPQPEAPQPEAPKTEPEEPEAPKTEQEEPPVTEEIVPSVIAVTGITLDQTALEVTVGELPMTLTATVQPEDATDKTVTWTSSEPGVASVENGVLTFGYMGEAVITATAGEFSASCTVTVGEGEAVTFLPEKFVDAAIFFSDLHTSKSDYKESTVKGIMNGLKTSGLSFSSVTSCGDAFSVNEGSGYTGYTSTITGYIQSVFTGIPVNYVWSDHDRCAVKEDGKTLLDNDSGFIYGAGEDGIYGNADDDNYYVYELSMADLSTNNRYNADFHSNAEVTATIADFVADADNLDQTKPLFIASHQPLLDRRNDNGHALEWATAINTVAENMDVAFFFGHNHKYDESGDYYYAKGSTMSVCKDSSGNAQNVTLNFPHICAGYMEPTSTGSYSSSGTRRSVAVAVTILEDSISYVTYDKNGVYNGNFALNETVKRAHANDEPATPETPDDTVIPGVSIVDANGNAVEAAVAVNNESSVQEAVASLLTNAVAYDIDIEGEVGNIVITLPIPEGVENPAVYYVPGNGEAPVDMEATKNADGTVSFTTDHNSVYAVGDRATTGDTGDTDNDLTPENATGNGTTTTTEEKEVYVLVSAPTAGKQYIIVNRNSAGSGYALKENTTTGSSITVNAAGNGVSNPYIETTDKTIMWNVTTGLILQSESGKYYLRYDRGLKFNQYVSSNWTYDGNKLRSTQYLRYNDGWTTTDKNNRATQVYFYEKQTIKIETSTPVSGTYSIAGDPAEVTKVVTNGSTVELGSKLTFTPSNGGAATTTVNPENAWYEIYRDPDRVISGINGRTVTFSGVYGEAVVKVSCEVTFGTEAKTVTNYIVVTASAPYYSIELCNPVTGDEGTTYEPITAPIALKGIQANDTYSVWAVVKEYDGVADANGEDGVDLGKLDDALNWSISDESIATIDLNTGVITFTGTHYGTVNVTVAYTGSDDKVITDTIVISVTKSQYVVPGDGTNDFPEYPNEGAIRFDKTATAVGNFSETGIAKVELSMTGVPYTTGSELDVVLMLDNSTSMGKASVDRIAFTQTAAKEFVKNIVINEDGTYNNNRIYVAAFMGGNRDYSQSSTSVHRSQILDLSGGFITISSDKELEAVLNAIDDDYGNNTGSYGTDYLKSLEDCYTQLANIKTEGRKQFCVYMSDGIPNVYKGITTEFESTNTIVTMFDVTGRQQNTGTATRNNKYEYEQFSTQMKANGITVFSVGLGLHGTNSSWSGTSAEVCEQVANMLLNDIAGPAGETAAQRDTGNAVSKLGTYFFSVADNNAAAEMENVFGTIAQKIVEAAKDVVVEDKIGEDYTVNFSFPNNGVTAEDTGMNEWYIQVLEYQLDSDKERTGTPAVLENFTFDANGAIKTHTVNGAVTCEGTACTHVTFTTDRVTKIDGTYFTYTCAPKLDANGNEVKNEVGDTITEEYLTWKADKLTTTELVLEYFAYLDNSAGFDADHQVPADTYYTNEYATLTYTNYKGNRVQREFPIPQMTWNGAQVTYVFYLVNEAGQPVNRAGRVVPFAESVYVTDPVTFNVTWNEQTGTENILAHDIFATAGVPEVYELYDDAAQYVIRVYQTENVDTNGKNGNYFQISGSDDKLIDSALDSDTTVNNSTTVVFNTKAGKKYDAYGCYSIYNEGTTLTNGTTNITTTVKAADIDYANTTVAFAVVWKPELLEDTVVVDYGLDVVIDVIKNDNMAAGVVGVRTDVPKSGSENVLINSGSFNAAKALAVDVSIDSNNDSSGLLENKIGTATVENLNSVRFSLDKDNGMQFTDPAVFYYEADVNFYDSNNELKTTSMYSKVTVIPATTIYYEDEFVDLKTYNAKFTEAVDITEFATGTVYYTKNTDGTYEIASKFETGKTYYTIPKTNGYNEVTGWDTNSVAARATQAQDRPGESKISAALDADNNYGYDGAYKTMSTYSMGSAAQVNVRPGKYATASFSFYGTGFDVISMTSDDTGVFVVQVFDANGNRVRNATIDTFYGMNADGKVSVNDPDAIYQVPVIRIFDLDYGKYTATITASYSAYLDHTTAAGYDLYLDAIRIYDPTGVAGGEMENDVVLDAYIDDGEAWPIYEELRNNIIEASNYEATTNEDGSVTVTGTNLTGAIFIDCQDNNYSIADYVSYGPNNELYLANGQAIAFSVDVTETMADVQLGIKVANGNTVTYEINGDSYTVNTATDMYYSIWDYAKSGEVVVIENVSGGILSLTNIKTTFNAETSTNGMLRMSAENVGTALMMLRKAPVVEEEVPETTVPETTEPEETKPTEPAEPDNSELKAAVKDAKKLKEKDYTKDSYKAVKSALKAAEKVLKDKKASQSKIDAALEALNDAIAGLEAKPDNSELKAAVKDAKKLKEKNYTKDSYKTVKSALKAAEKVLKNKKATQDKIDEALAELNEAVEALEAVASKGKPGKKK